MAVRDVEEKGHALPSDVFAHLVYVKDCLNIEHCLNTTWS